MVKYDVGLKIHLHQSISEPVCYGDLVYKFKRIGGKASFRDKFQRSPSIIKEWDIAGMFNM